MDLAIRSRIVAVLVGFFALSLFPVKAGMTPDEVKEFDRFKTQAEHGVAAAQLVLGGFYGKGQGVAKDEVEAVKWYRKAAEQGDSEAQLNMGICYFKGLGVAKDEIEAYAYWNLAGITDELARKNLAILEREMSPDARLLGQQRTKQLRKEIEGRLESAEEVRKAIEKERSKGA